MKSETLHRYARHRRRAVTHAPLFEALEPRTLLSGNLVVSELMAVNKATLADDDGEFTDWFEIHNTTNQLINLDGWGATDDPSDLEKFQFGDIDILAGGFVVAFASGKDRAGSNAAPSHTNFQLGGDGEFFALVQPDRATIEFEYNPAFPAQAADISFGLAFNGSNVDVGTQAFFVNPTPGVANDQGTTITLPEFSVESGTFLNSFQITLTTSSPTAAIYYTLDESSPTTGSTLYSNSITIDATTMVRAIAVEPGLAAGPVVSATYVKLASDLTSFTSDLPVIVLDNFDSGSVPNNVKQHAFLGLFEPDEISGRTSLDDAASITTRSGIKIRGSSTQNQPKKNFSVEFWDEQGEDRSLDVLGLPSDGDWILHAPYSFDRSIIRNPLIYELSNQAGRYAVRTRFVEVFVNTNGGDLSYVNDYVGVYVLMEKIETGRDRVDINKISPSDVTEPDISGGYIVKIDRLDPGDGGFNGGGIQMGFVDPNEEDVLQIQKDWIKQYYDDFDTALDGPDFADPQLGYANYIDVDSWIDHNIFNVLMKNVDALRLSTYMFKPENGKIEAGPIWDFDRSADSYDGRDNATDTWKGTGDATDYFSWGWWDRLFDDPNFWQQWVDRWQELRETVLSTENMHAVIDSMTAELTESAARNFDRWSSVPPRNGSLQGEIDHLKQWMEDRAAWIDTQLTTPPTFNQDGGLVTPGFEVLLASDAGEVFYTVDGTDPRLPGGGISPTASSLGGTTFDSTLIEAGSTWKYLDNGTNQLDAWRQPGFDDTSWQSGTAQLGYGNNGEATTVSFGPASNNKYITTYFRSSFDVQDIHEITALTMGIVRDDGAVIYLNGTELERPNMPTGQINYLTRANGAVGGADESRFFDFIIDSNLLVEGSNEIAVEIHQANPSSSDISFDFRLIAGRHVVGDAIVITDNTKVIARALNGSNWSRQVEATFVIDVPQVRITELNYNPYDPAEGSAFGTSDFEFVELQNVGGAAVDLINTTLSGGIDFVFPNLILAPNAIVLVVKAVAAFESRYGTGHTIAGQLAGKLDNGGEQILLHNSIGELVTDFTFDNKNGWPQRADGDGSSIEIIDVQIDYNDNDNWRASAEYGGTPGELGEGHSGDIVINEILSHTDLPFTDSIELHNTTDSTIEISGWYLSDSTNYKKFKVPQNTFIETGGYIVFDESDFNTSVGTDPSDFALSGSQGDEVYLLEANSIDELIRFVDQVEFGAAINGESFGRVPNGTGELYPLLSLTLGQTNSPPRVGPIVITEVMYNPVDPGNLPIGMTVDDLEFVEIHNPTSLDVDLTNWRIRKGIDFDFESGTVLDAGQTLLIVPFDPATEPTKKAFFEATYNLAAGAILLGPYQGKLDNGGERIQLQRPDSPPAESPTFIPRLLEDEVRYDDVSPWPISSDGTGESLHRRSNNLWGNSASSWRSGAPTPGSIDDMPPIIMGVIPNGGDSQRSLITSLAYQFDEAVNIGAALELVNVTTGQTIDSSVFAMDYDDESHIATWTFPGITSATLPEGWYRATLHDDQITDMAGNMIDGDVDGDTGGNHLFTFFRFFGDGDGNQTVDIGDLFRFRSTYQTDDDDPAYNSTYDNDFDGDIDIGDLFRFRSNYQRTTEPPDLAGDDFAQAFDLGLLSAAVVIDEFIGRSDQADVFKFELEQPAALAISLLGFAPNMRLSLYDVDFNLIALSDSGQTLNELFESNVLPGTYFILVDLNLASSSTYRLTIAPE